MDNTVKKSSQSDSFPSGLDNDNSVDTVCLNDLYPTDNRDLNSLFPERELRKLFRDVVAGIEDVRRFVDKTEKSLVTERSKKSSGRGTLEIPCGRDHVAL